jgi:hypothetical protein
VQWRHTVVGDRAAVVSSEPQSEAGGGGVVTDSGGKGRGEAEPKGKQRHSRRGGRRRANQPHDSRPIDHFQQGLIYVGPII